MIKFAFIACPSGGLPIYTQNWGAGLCKGFF